MMDRRQAAVVWTLVGGAALVWMLTPGPAAEAPVVRVCADPNNLPFSNDRREGFENRLAEMLARDVGARLELSELRHRSRIERQGFSLTSSKLNHPIYFLVYRIYYVSLTLVYATDT